MGRCGGGWVFGGGFGFLHFGVESSWLLVIHESEDRGDAQRTYGLREPWYAVFVSE